MAVLRFVALVVLGWVGLTAALQAADEQVLRVPLMPEGKLLHKVNPEYPSAAIQHRVQGTVRFQAVIGKDGHIERLRLISGHRLLVRAAREAARQRIYRPTLIGDKPVRVITQIEVHFRLDPYGKPPEIRRPSERARSRA